MPNTITKDLGPVSGYAIAVENGYTGTEEEWIAEVLRGTKNAQTATQKADEAAASERVAAESADDASDSADSAKADALKAEGNAVGKQNDVDVVDGPYYHNNAKYYAEQASTATDTATGAAQAAAASAAQAEAWATGGSGGTASATNNAEYWAGQAAASAEDAETAAVAGTAALVNEATTFDASTAYTAGEYVLYNSVLYRFTADHAAGAWTGIDATAVKIGGEIEELKTHVDNMIVISDDRPTPDDNKIWIDSDAESVQIPTMEDLLKAFIEETTVKGFVANIPDGANGIPIKQITVFGTPIQEGTGDPSSSNIRAISGRTSCAINHSGADTTDYDALNISFPSNAGTVYAFQLTINDDGTGQLVKTHIFMELPSSGWNKAGSRFWVAEGRMKNTYGGNVGWCSHYKPVMAASSTSGDICFGDKNYSTSARIVIADSRFSTAADLQNYISAQKSANTPVQVVFPLAAPITYNLSVNQVMSILGENNLWSEAGDIQVTYRADTKLYIDSLRS